MTPDSDSNKHKQKTGNLTQWANELPPDLNVFQTALHTITRVLLIFVQEFKRNKLSLRSGALTYTILLSMVPMLALSTAVVKGLGGSNQLRQVVYSYIETLDSSTSTQQEEQSPDLNTESQRTSRSAEASSNLTEHIYSAADKLFAYVERTNFATLGTIGVVGIFISVILMLSTVEIAMNSIWHVSSGRSFFRKITDYLTLIILFPLSINIGFAASAILKNPTLFTKINQLLPIVWIQAFFLKLVPVFFITLTFFVTYLFFPNTKVQKAPAFIGALMAGFFWINAQNIYFHLQIGVANYNAIYGSFATLPLLLIWLYVGWFFILAGALLAYAIQNRDSYQLVSKPSTPAQLLASAFDTLSHVYSRFDNRTPVTVADINHKLTQYDPSTISQTVSLLAAANLIRLHGDDQQLLPAAPADKTNHNDIIMAVFGTSSDGTAGSVESNRIIHSVCDDAKKCFKETQQSERENSTEENEK